MLDEQTMNSIKIIAEAVYVYGTMTKGEAKTILIRSFGMKDAQCLDDGTIFVVDAQGQDAYLQFPLLTIEEKQYSMSM